MMRRTAPLNWTGEKSLRYRQLKTEQNGIGVHPNSGEVTRETNRTGIDPEKDARSPETTEIGGIDPEASGRGKRGGIDPGIGGHGAAPGIGGREAAPETERGDGAVRKKLGNYSRPGTCLCKFIIVNKERCCFRKMAEALIDSNCDLSSVVKGNPSQYVKLNVGGSLHYTTIGRVPYSDGNPYIKN
jgi:hypothetical protein